MTPPRPIFVSYAHEDAAEARHIVEALRAAGLEVWFDANELRGGDQWDRKIRQQIKACGLFLPVISQNTQKRREAYFRLEWKLADDRTHMMAAGTPFLIPVIIDDTTEYSAEVPDSFGKVQFTRLSNAAPTPEFIKLVQELAVENSEEETPAPVHTPAPTKTPSPAPVSTPPESKPTKKILITAGVLALLIALGFGLFRSGGSGPDNAAPAEVAATPAISPKSIAVLPFTNMSDESDSAYFTDGIHEDVLTKLALISELRVVSRTSVMQYRDRPENVREIAAELNVAFILEGSVRRAGNKVRVTGQLIRAATDEHVWADSYDRDLTDIFAIQSELAHEIASALSTVLTPQEQKLVDQRPTDNVAAYDAYMQAREILQSGYQSGFDDLEPLLKTAVLLDPQFSHAWAELGSVYARRYFDNWDRSEEILTKAKDAIDQAIAIAPEDPFVIQKEGDYFYYGFRDYAKAEAKYQQLAENYPNFAPAIASLGFIQRRQDHWQDAMDNLRRAVELEPRNRRYLSALGETAGRLRLYDEATEAFERFLELAPDDFYARGLLASMSFDADGSTTELDAIWQEVSTQPGYMGWIFRAGLQMGKTAELLKIVESYFTQNPDREIPPAGLVSWALVYWFEGQKEEATELLTPSVLAVMEEDTTNEENTWAWFLLGQTYTMVGDKTGALRCVEKLRSLVPESQDAWDGPEGSEMAAMLLAWNGETDAAIDEAERLLSIPSGARVHSLRVHAGWSILRGHPRFEALLDDPANNAPLI